MNTAYERSLWILQHNPENEPGLAPRAANLAVEVGFERSVESRLDEAHLLWGHLAARSCCGSGRGHRRRREAPERSLGLFPCRQAPDHLRVPAQHRNSLRSGFQFFGRYECLDLPRAVPAGVILSDQLGLFLEDMEVVDRGLGGVHLVQHGRGDGGERGYALAVVTWCAACHEKAGKKEGSDAEEALATSSRSLRLGYISHKRHSFTDYRCFAL